MTPMIDVVFLLIIFFLCIDFRILEAKVPAYLPKEVGSNSELPLSTPLRVQIICDSPGVEKRRPRSKTFYREGHRVHFAVGPRKVETLTDLRDELRRIHADPNYLEPDPQQPGMLRHPRVIVEPRTGTVYGDVAGCVDAIQSAGFEDIRFCGGMDTMHDFQRRHR